MIDAAIDYKRRDGRTILGPLSLIVADGEFIALTGPSGCGKTTLLGILAGLDADYAGAVRVTGRLGMVFQDPRLLPWRSVADNIRLAAPAADVGVALDAVGLAGKGGLYPHQLSLGMARRAALARALAVEPQVLLLDEPFVSLDADSAELVRRLVGDYWRARRPTVVMVTHDAAEAEAMAGRIVRLGAGGTILETRYTTGAPYPQEYGMGPVNATVSPASIS